MWLAKEIGYYFLLSASSDGTFFHYVVKIKDSRRKEWKWKIKAFDSVRLSDHFINIVFTIQGLKKSRSADL